MTGKRFKWKKRKATLLAIAMAATMAIQPFHVRAATPNPQRAITLSVEDDVQVSGSWADI